MRLTTYGLAAIFALAAQAAFGQQPPPNFVNVGRGPIIPNADVVVVYLGTPDPEFRRAMDVFYSELQNDGTFLQSLSEYGVSRGRYSGSFVIPPPFLSVDPASIGAILDTNIRNGVLPGTTSNRVYMVHIARNVVVVSGFSILGIPAGIPPGLWCGMHTAYRNSLTGTGFLNPMVVYSILPSQSLPGMEACRGTLDAFQSETVLASHELAEAATDPGSVLFEFGLGSIFYSQPNAWIDPAQSKFLDPTEVSDVCDGLESLLQVSLANTFTVARNWSQSRSICSRLSSTNWVSQVMAVSPL